MMVRLSNLLLVLVAVLPTPTTIFFDDLRSASPTPPPMPQAIAAGELVAEALACPSTAVTPPEVFAAAEKMLESGREDLAAACFAKTIQLNPLYSLAYAALADLYVERAHYAAALELHLKAFRQQPMRVSAELG